MVFEFPKIEHAGKVFWQVGCKLCGDSNFLIFSTDKKEILSKCKDCDNITEFSKLQFEKELIKQAFDLRFLS